MRELSIYIDGEHASCGNRPTPYDVAGELLASATESIKIYVENTNERGVRGTRTVTIDPRTGDVWVEDFRGPGWRHVLLPAGRWESDIWFIPEPIIGKKR